MHALYNFHFLDTVSEQLLGLLENLELTVLDVESIAALEEFQRENDTDQGVYLIYYGEEPAYVGKAYGVAGRLAQHLRKLRGRQNIKPEKIGYKAVFLDKSMSTAANEKVLIRLLGDKHPNMWNGKGFGPKDPGSNRDSTQPSYFDTNYPIRLDIEIEGIQDAETLDSACAKMKSALPYVFRYKLEKAGDTEIDFTGIDRTPQPLLTRIVQTLGGNWRGAILSFGIVLYNEKRNYPFGEVIDPPDS